jgi:hypothetical protein
MKYITASWLQNNVCVGEHHWSVYNREYMIRTMHKGITFDVGSYANYVIAKLRKIVGATHTISLIESNTVWKTINGVVEPVQSYVKLKIEPI